MHLLTSRDLISMNGTIVFIRMCGDEFPKAPVCLTLNNRKMT